MQAQRALELNPNFGRAHAVLGHCYLALGRLDAAIEEFGRSGNNNGNVGHAYALAGRTTEARRVLQALEERYAKTGGGAGELAQVYVGVAEFDRAFEWLTRAVEDGSGWTLKVAVVWDPLRSDPRFAADREVWTVTTNGRAIQSVSSSARQPSDFSQSDC